MGPTFLYDAEYWDLMVQYFQCWVQKYRLEKANGIRVGRDNVLRQEVGPLACSVNCEFLVRTMVVGGDESPLFPPWHFAFHRRSTDHNGRPRRGFEGSGILLDCTPYRDQYGLLCSHQWRILEENQQPVATWGSVDKYPSLDRSMAYAMSLVKDFSNGDDPIDCVLVRLEGMPRVPRCPRIPGMQDFNSLLEAPRETNCVVFGWGVATRNKVDRPYLLRFAVMELDHLLSRQPPYLICQSFDDRGPARGDSGGALTALIGNEIVLLGMVKGDAANDAKWHHTQDNPCRFVALPIIFERLHNEIIRLESDPVQT